MHHQFQGSTHSATEGAEHLSLIWQRQKEAAVILT